MGIDGPRMVTALVTKDVMGLGCENCKRDYISVIPLFVVFDTILRMDQRVE